MAGDTKTGIEKSLDRLAEAINRQSRAQVFASALAGILASTDRKVSKDKAVDAAADIAKRAERIGYGNL